MGLAASTNSEGSSISSSHSAISWWMCRLVRLSDLMDVGDELWNFLSSWKLNPEEMVPLNVKLQESFLCFVFTINRPNIVRFPREIVQVTLGNPWSGLLSSTYVLRHTWTSCQEGPAVDDGRNYVFLGALHYWLPIPWKWLSFWEL